MVRWWATVVVGAAAALLFAWLGRVAGVSLATLVTIGAGLAALMWTIVLVTWPWNLYFDARQVTAENAVSRERGIDVPKSAGRGGQADRAGGCCGSRSAGTSAPPPSPPCSPTCPAS